MVDLLEILKVETGRGCVLEDPEVRESKVEIRLHLIEKDWRSERLATTANLHNEPFTIQSRPAKTCSGEL